MEYQICRASAAVVASDPWADGGWDSAPIANVDHFHAKSTDHRPITRVKVVHVGQSLHVAFHVQDRYVRAVHEGYQDRVSRDSCVEFFVEPRPGQGYFNFEWSAGGAMLVFFIEDPSPGQDALFKKFTVIPPDIGRRVTVQASLPRRVDPEIVEPTTWTLRATIPLSVFSDYLGPLGALPGQRWRGNFFKCGDQTSRPHWASWSPIGEALRFHQPQYFAPLVFE